MRYWFFNGKTPDGPYEEEELKKLPGFNSKSLICPENAQSSNQWKPAQYYLIQPPSQKVPDGAKLPGRNRMGRLAEIEESEKNKETPDASSPSVEPQNISHPKIWPKVLLLSCAAAALIYFAPKMVPLMRSFQKKSSPALPQSQDEGDRAVEAVQNFPIKGVHAKSPAALGDILSPSHWKTPKTIGELLKNRSLREMSFQTAVFLKMAGLNTQGAAEELAQNPDRWNHWAQNFLARHWEFEWSALGLGGSLYQVTAQAPEAWSLAGRKDIFEYDAQARTVKPLNFNAWHDLGAPAASIWARQNVQLGVDIDDSALAAAAPVYSLKDFEIKKAPERKLKRPKPMALPPHAPSAAPQSPNSARVHAPPNSSAQNPPHAAPGLSPSPSQPKSDTAHHKNAANMSLDELNKYLKRAPNSGGDQKPQ